MASADHLYEKYVASVRDGFIPFEQSARHLALANDLPLDPLETALDEAYRRLLGLYIDEIQQGRTSFAEAAYDVANKRNYCTDAITQALSSAAKLSSSRPSTVVPRSATR
jgi:hypothetical protein